MVNDALDRSIPLQMSDSKTSKTSTNLQSLDKDALADESEGGDLLDDSVEHDLVKGDGVLSLILDLSLGPLLFLCGFTATRWRGCFSFGLESMQSQ